MNENDDLISFISRKKVASNLCTPLNLWWAQKKLGDVALFAFRLNMLFVLVFVDFSQLKFSIWTTAMEWMRAVCVSV